MFSTSADAQAAVSRIVKDSPNVGAFIVDDCNRWLIVCEPKKGMGWEEEEIAAEENNDHSNGRMGSVCNLRRTDEGGSGDSGPTTCMFSNVATRNPSSDQKEVQLRRKQLDELLATPLTMGVTVINDARTVSIRYRMGSGNNNTIIYDIE